MQSIKQQVLALLTNYNQGHPVGYPVIDRKMMAQHADVVKDGKLGTILDEMVAENLIEQVGPSTY